MRVAFVGKGGAGKSAIAGALARLLAARGEPVLAVDSDPLPGLAFSVGVDLTDAGIPDAAVEEDPDGDGARFRLRAGLSATDAVRCYAAVGADGIRFLQFGKARGAIGGLRRSQAAFHRIVDDLPPGAWHVVGDLPGGTRQPFFGWARYARSVLVVVEPTAKSILSARRLAKLAGMAEAPRVVAVANKLACPADPDVIARRTGLEVVGAVPWDPGVAEADRLGRPLVDHAPDSPAVVAVTSLLDRLWREEADR